MPSLLAGAPPSPSVPVPALRHDVEDPAVCDVMQHRDVVVPPAEAFLIKPSAGQTLERAPIKTTCHGALHDTVHLIPGKRREPLGLDFAAYRLQGLNGKGLKEFGKAEVFAGPGDLRLLHPHVEQLTRGTSAVMNVFHGIVLRCRQRRGRLPWRGTPCPQLRQTSGICDRPSNLHGNLPKRAVGGGWGNVRRTHLPGCRQTQKHLIELGIAHRGAILARRRGVGKIASAHTIPSRAN